MKDFNIPKHTVIQYVRDKNGDPRGVLVAVKLPNPIGYRIGYSLCNKKDRFSKDMALKIAIGRASDLDGTYSSIPNPVAKMIPAFTDRCKKYYKVA